VTSTTKVKGKKILNMNALESKVERKREKQVIARIEEEYEQQLWKQQLEEYNEFTTVQDRDR
jgi:hypothetical protein